MIDTFDIIFHRKVREEIQAYLYGAPDGDGPPGLVAQICAGLPNFEQYQRAIGRKEGCEIVLKLMEDINKRLTESDHPEHTNSATQRPN